MASIQLQTQQQQQHLHIDIKKIFFFVILEISSTHTHLHTLKLENTSLALVTHHWFGLFQDAVSPCILGLLMLVFVTSHHCHCFSFHPLLQSQSAVGGQKDVPLKEEEYIVGDSSGELSWPLMYSVTCQLLYLSELALIS